MCINYVVLIINTEVGTIVVFYYQNLVREMNRLGMMVDISHVSVNVMNEVLDHSLAPG